MTCLSMIHQQIHHPQMMGMAPSRVPLPVLNPQEEVIFINPKQYNGIMRRRKHRAKLEAQTNPVKARKVCPYLTLASGFKATRQ